MDIKGKIKQFILSIKKFISKIPIKDFFCKLKNGTISFFDSLISKIKNIFSKKKSPEIKEEKIKRGRSFSLKNNKLSRWLKKYKNERNLAFLVLSSLLFLITVCFISMNMGTILGTNKTNAKAFEEDD